MICLAEEGAVHADTTNINDEIEENGKSSLIKTLEMCYRKNSVVSAVEGVSALFALGGSMVFNLHPIELKEELEDPMPVDKANIRLPIAYMLQFATGLFLFLLHAMKPRKVTMRAGLCVYFMLSYIIISLQGLVIGNTIGIMDALTDTDNMRKVMALTVPAIVLVLGRFAVVMLELYGVVYLSGQN